MLERKAMRELAASRIASQQYFGLQVIVSAQRLHDLLKKRAFAQGWKPNGVDIVIRKARGDDDCIKTRL